ncbi:MULTISPECIES: nitrogenase iron-molybdenum cofactor biosynthesis protein NifE [Acetobacter]|jgi:nitrogenase molybdenum-cofactor synthesis protein NifE|uniref:Nitrogenase iron-molybdenum cofactor biosynthesis protein NifE n=1 Tax=Acetobacter lovaniensis TaxID=104100 RepID=A0A841QE69_9PROT|nr:nitrogenase iron-molybdenum cofactor biosynthesis protein NifE [Acetobacter lovaniensis]MBB6456695.1 nitrogenase molybdenum-cofactor synthesis protein NifE [Acetobacter lovaniensis]MCI1796288.1 nitrogenase iron-molybdenum cofactor biosynthesis protein NifE [Acetobacter lovaniensis]MCP1239281.1 nitrogenase iron-molybdenum cofactor biosynthesis protein NifE [Acetobacter lovaniensis]NHN81486.1 nitrogenase iron-molybdenum cofactor biosynthesis protein NifE [Acetobacter lovaniensis]GBQ65538.1 ni
MAESLNAKITALFDEPGCNTNVAKGEKARKKGCSKPLQPGAAAGGCAFDGAKIALQPITDVVHLVHGPLACEGNGWDNRHAASSGPTLYRIGATTDITETDIIMGNGEKRLYRAMREVVERYAPPAIFVYSTCVTALIGDDINAVCRHATEKFGIPCIPVNAPGFVGSKNLGNKLAGEALLDHVIGTMEPEVTTPTDINILGDYNLSGELWQVKPLLEQLGIRLNACITGDARYREVATAHRARVNMMVCSTALINVARKMEERWGIPYFEGSFYGISDTSEALRTLARLLVAQGADAGLIVRAENLIEAEEKRAWSRLDAYRSRLAGKRVLLYTGGVKSWSIVSALQEMGMVIVSTSVRKSTDNDKQKIKDLMGGDAHMVNSIPPREMYAQLRRGDADILLSGGRTQFVALKARTPWLDINQERHHAFAGYDGMVTLVRQLDASLSNPVWKDVRRLAPWEQEDGETGFDDEGVPALVPIG